MSVVAVRRRCGGLVVAVAADSANYWLADEVVAAAAQHG